MSPWHTDPCRLSRPIFWGVLVLCLLVTRLNLAQDDEETVVGDIKEEEEPSELPIEDDKYSFGQRSREHIHETLRLETSGDALDHQFLTGTLKKLSNIYNNAIKPLESAYKFNAMNRHVVNDGEIFAMPRILFVGPWSTGKSSMINYIVNLEDSSVALPAGAQPTTSDFTVLMYGEEYKTVEGMVLAVDGGYSSLEKFGQSFIDRLQGVKLPNKLLEKVTIIDTPGIIENRKQQERGYPFNDVCKWFIDRADLIFVVFDPTKLDVGIELEALFKQLKTHEAKVRIILNKADSVTPQELMRVYGALFWSLAPLINVTEPPRVYTGSFWSKEFKTDVNADLFLAEELSLLNDMYEVIANRLENKIAFIRQHAILVRNHALVVDRYNNALREHKSIFRDTNEVADDIVNNPTKYRIYQSVLDHEQVSKHDLIALEEYKTFFTTHLIDSFQPLSSQCGIFSSCLLDKIDFAISSELPALLTEVATMYRKNCGRDPIHEKNKYKKPTG